MKKYILLACTGLALLSCERFRNKDQKQNQTERIVSVSKQHTEIMYALGAVQNMVAVDVSSTYPEAAKKLPTVGYHRALSLEGLVAAKPTMIIHDGPASIGPEHVVRQLEQLKIPMKQFSVNGSTLDSTKLLFQEMGQYFHREKQADSLSQKLEKEMQQALTKAKTYTQKPKVLIIHYGQANNVYLVMTGKSTAAKMVDWAGGTMAVEGDRGMKQLSAEVVAKSNPDVILLTDFGYDKLGSKQKISELPGVSATNAFKNGRIYRVEEHDLVYLGPRTGQNVLALQKLIHENGAVQ
ncbi:ABC transporter substrate-binding protein [Nibribacter ruber]|uniref:ABC transporter substrate-binding protein n=1 Tax=Nibribacter ruber TaxID=2698458 RepID=A0A6P1P3W2_9BACT|nr:ABC transporter substrate-binding protein [Nibribacter ruber]QHL89144.1 ABC transporter substrate-binding protein [Nibribacter ruber]